MLGSCSGMQLDCGGDIYTEWRATNRLCLMSFCVKWGAFYVPVTHRVLVRLNK